MDALKDTPTTEENGSSQTLVLNYTSKIIRLQYGTYFSLFFITDELGNITLHLSSTFASVNGFSATMALSDYCLQDGHIALQSANLARYCRAFNISERSQNWYHSQERLKPWDRSSYEVVNPGGIHSAIDRSSFSRHM